jgi:hypothetical protein
MSFSRFTNLELISPKMRTVICSQLSHGVLNMWKNLFNLELNVQRIHDVRQMDIQSAEPLEQELLHVGDKITI